MIHAPVVHLHTSEALDVDVVPGRGCVISSARLDGREALARMPWLPQPASPLCDEPEWVAAWTGGWQPLLPNAGGVSTDGPTAQCFHGNASIAPWDVVEQEDRRVRCRWAGDGILAERTVRLDADCIEVTTFVQNISDHAVPVIVTEHAILGGVLLEDVAMIDATTASIEELAYDGGRLDGRRQPWHEASGWHRVHDGTPARLGVLHDADEHDGVTVSGGGLRVHLTWDLAALPFAWVWQERNASQGPPWGGRVRALGIEPSSCPHGAGLDTAMAEGSARILPPGGTMRWWMRMRIQED